MGVKVLFCSLARMNLRLIRQANLVTSGADCYGANSVASEFCCCCFLSRGKRFGTNKSRINSLLNVFRR